MKRSEAIDCLRGLSILAVVAHHINLRLHYGALLPDILNRALFWSGSQAVKVFFAISGYLITTNILKRWGTLRDIDVKRFYQLRFARIAPLLLALTAVLSMLHLTGANGFVINPKRASLPRAVLAALTFHVNWLEAHVGYLPGAWDILWSLSVEEAFYFFYPLLCRYVRWRWILWALAAALLVAGPLYRSVWAMNEIASDYAWLANMDCIAIGCIAAVVPKPRRRIPVRIAGIAMIALVIVFRSAARAMGLYTYETATTVLAAGAAFVLVSTDRAPWTRPLRWYGVHSYEVYLTHMFVVTWGTQLFAASGTPLPWAPLWFAGMIGIAGVLGAVVSRTFSEPMNRRLRAAWPPRVNAAIM